MKVTGYQLREALRRWQLRRDSAASRFKDSLHKFAGEEKEGPQLVASRVSGAEASIAQLQSWQARYNLKVHVQVRSVDKQTTLPLLEAVKLLGGLTRSEKAWREAAVVKKGSAYFSLRSNPLERDGDKLIAQRTVSYEDAGKEAEAYARSISALREAIAVGNASELTLEGFPAALLE